VLISLLFCYRYRLGEDYSRFVLRLCLQPPPIFSLDMIRAAIKPKTRAAYESGMRAVMRFLLSLSTPLSPDVAFNDPVFWAMFIVYQADRGLKPETVRHYIAAAKLFLQRLGKNCVL